MKDSDDRPTSLEEAGLSSEQEDLIRRAFDFLHSTVFAESVYLGEPDELPYPQKPLVQRIVRTICETAHIDFLDLPPDQPDEEFQEAADKWFKIKTAEDEEAANRYYWALPQSHTFRARQAVKHELWRTMVRKLRPPRPKSAVVEQLEIEPPAPERGKKICPNPKCRKSLGSRRMICSCGFRFPPKVSSPVKLAKGEKLCPDCYMVCNCGRHVCPLCFHAFGRKRSAIPPYIAIVIREMSGTRRYKLQKVMRTFWEKSQKARKRTLAELRNRIANEPRIDRRPSIYQRQQRKWDRDDKLEYLIWLTARVVRNDF